MNILKTAFALLVLGAACLAAGCGGTEQAQEEKNGDNQGAVVDRVILTVTTDQSDGLRDVAEGRADIMLTAVSPAVLKTVSNAQKEKLEFYTVPSGSLSLLTNPIPNKPPYTWKKADGVTVFNPLAIREVRYALNWLIDRKKIVDEALQGEGSPMMTAMIPQQPGVYRYNLIAAKLGMSESGDEQKAFEMIDRAMNAAADLPENRGILIKKDGFWQYNGNDALIKLYIRADDSSVRVPVGEYIADQLEKAGLRVKRLMWDRSKVQSVVYNGNPADYEWTMYTEAWHLGATRRWWDGTLSQMYAPFFGYILGQGVSGSWCYTNERVDTLAKKGYYGHYMDEERYWSGNLEALGLALKDSVRIYVCSQVHKYVVNKERFNSRMLYGPGEGINKWSIRYADIKPEPEGSENAGKRVLRLVQYSAHGEPFMSDWNVIGRGGFIDIHSSIISGALSDTATDKMPNDASDFGLVSGVDIDSAIIKPRLDREGTLTGDVPVPAHARVYDSTTKKWQTVGDGHTAAVKATGAIRKGYVWHNGEPLDMNDVRYATAFAVEWATKDGEDDPYFDTALSLAVMPTLENIKGRVYHEDGSVTTYADYYFAADKNRTIIKNGAVGVKAANPDRFSVVPWEIYEALSEMVAKGSPSGQQYRVAQGKNGIEINVLDPTCAADIKAALEVFVSSKYIPVSLQGIIESAEALKRYRASIAFIEKYGHAYISNGPLMLTKIDAENQSLSAEKFEQYPYPDGYWTRRFSQKMTSIDFVRDPNAPSQGKDVVFEILVSSYMYPAMERGPLDEGTVTVILQKEDGEAVYTAERKAAGKFVAIIPSADLRDLKSGVKYPVVITSAIGKEVPSVVTVQLQLE